jgi:hypothetical protein
MNDQDEGTRERDNKYPIEYLIQKYEEALYDLATGEGDARARVGTAHSGLMHIQIDEYPESLRKQRREIDRLLTRLGGKTGHIIPNNLQKMKNKTASKIAALILDIYFSLVEKQAKAGNSLKSSFTR